MLKPGDEAPPFDLESAIDGRIARVRMKDLTRELIVLFFYPADFSFICPTEVVGFQKQLAQFNGEQAHIVAASVDSAQSHLRWAQELGGISFPLLADSGGQLAQSYGAFDAEEKTAIRATFIIDRERRIAYAVSSRANVGRSVTETLRVVRALRSGKLCPADWAPGQDFGPADLNY